MIKVCFYTRNKTYYGFKIIGHADYGCCGKDVVCAGVSALVINTVNAIEEFTEDKTRTSEFESGLVKFKIVGDVSPKSQLLMRALRLGLCSIYEEYGDRYIRIFFREVSHV